LTKAEVHKQRREKHLEEQRKLKRRFGWLASLNAALIIGFFQVFEAYLKTWFSVLEASIEQPILFFGFLALHLYVIIYIATHL